MANRMLDALRRFHRDHRAQAMTEAAIALPVVVLFTLAAHEFMWFNHNLHRTIWATRYITWEVSESTNHPDHQESGTGETSAVKRDEHLNQAVTEAYDLFFRLPGPGADKPGHKRAYHTYWRPVTNDTTAGLDGGPYGYHNSFPFTDDDGFLSGDGPGGVIGNIIEFLFAGGTVADLGLPEGASKLIGNSFTIGPDLPVRGYYRCGYVTGWKPAFFRILLPGEGRSRGDKAFWSSGGQPEQWESISVERGGARVLWLGWLPSEGKAPWYSRLAIITHNWMGQDAEADMHYHTKGFTLLGSFADDGTGSAMGAVDGGGGYGVDISTVVGVLFGDILPFRCFVYPAYVGQPSEGAQMQSTKG